MPVVWCPVRLAVLQFMRAAEYQLLMENKIGGDEMRDFLDGLQAGQTQGRISPTTPLFSAAPVGTIMTPPDGRLKRVLPMLLGYMRGCTFAVHFVAPELCRCPCRDFLLCQKAVQSTTNITLVWLRTQDRSQILAFSGVH